MKPEDCNPELYNITVYRYKTKSPQFIIYEDDKRFRYTTEEELKFCIENKYVIQINTPGLEDYYFTELGMAWLRMMYIL
jgi:hypothetical protein